jgi:hypothetical protein
VGINATSSYCRFTAVIITLLVADYRIQSIHLARRVRPRLAASTSQVSATTNRSVDPKSGHLTQLVGKVGCAPSLLWQSKRRPIWYNNRWLKLAPSVGSVDHHTTRWTLEEMKLSDSHLRLVTATLGGSLLVGLVGVAFIGLLFGLPLVLDLVHPMDRVNDLRNLPYRLTVGAIGGAILGGLAVFASRRFSALEFYHRRGIRRHREVFHGVS